MGPWPFPPGGAAAKRRQDSRAGALRRGAGDDGRGAGDDGRGAAGTSPMSGKALVSDVPVERAMNALRVGGPAADTVACSRSPRTVPGPRPAPPVAPAPRIEHGGRWR